MRDHSCSLLRDTVWILCLTTPAIVMGCSESTPSEAVQSRIGPVIFGDGDSEMEDGRVPLETPASETNFIAHKLGGAVAMIIEDPGPGLSLDREKHPPCRDRPGPDDPLPDDEGEIDPSDRVGYADPDRCDVHRVRLASADNVCRDERFATSTTARVGLTGSGVPYKRITCTGFLVGDDLLLTAGHCVRPDSEPADPYLPVPACKDISIVFGNAPARPVSRSRDLYRCAEVLDRHAPGLGVAAGLDWALIRLGPWSEDRSRSRTEKIAVNGHHRLRLERSTYPTIGDRAIHIGHGLGLRKMVTATVGQGPANFARPTLQGVQAGCTTARRDLCLLESNNDAFHGDSGSPFIDDLTGRVIGILAAGPVANYRLDPAEQCNRYHTCSAQGCPVIANDPLSLRWVRGANIRSVNFGQIPELPASGVRISADFDADQRMDTLRLDEPNGMNTGFVLSVTWGNPAKQRFEYRTGVRASDLPPQFDLSWTLTVTDLNNDGKPDLMSHFPGFAPYVLYGGSELKVPPTSPFPAAQAVQYTGNYETRKRGYQFPLQLMGDLTLVNAVTGRAEHYLGSPAGLMRTVPLPSDCTVSGTTTPEVSPRALAVLPPTRVDGALFESVAMVDCPASSVANQVVFVSLLDNREIKRAVLPGEGSWRAFAYRPDMYDVLMLAETDTGFSVHSYDPLWGTLRLLFQKSLSGLRAEGIAWKAPDGTQPGKILVALDSSDEDHLRAFSDTGVELADDPFLCAENPTGIRDDGPAAIAASYGNPVLSCRFSSTFGTRTRLAQWSNNALEAGADFYGFSHLRNRYQVQDLECDPLLPLLWVLDGSGTAILGRPLDSPGMCLPAVGLSADGLPQFDSGAWESPAPLRTDPEMRALIVDAEGYVPVEGPEFSTDELRAVGSHMAFDVMVPGDAASQYWAGDVQLYLSQPAENHYQGIEGLTSLQRGQWHSLRFPLTASARSALLARGSKVAVKLAVNRPQGAQGVALRNLRFEGDPR